MEVIKMKKIKLNGIKEIVYYDKLKNGLEIYIVPKTNRNHVFVTLTTKYGSNDIEFIPLGEKKYYKSPFGVAHFLEHKVFNTPNNTSALTLFAQNGITINAFTSYKQTTYYFDCINNIEDNINALLDFVQNPEFDEKSVIKEQGIIEQEIKGTEDDPITYGYLKFKENLIIKNYYKYMVAGRVNDIKNITKEDLEKCYRTFYNPSNMCLIITGNIEPENILKVVETNQEKKQFQNNDIKLKYVDEPMKVVREYEELKMRVKTPKFLLGYKIKIDKNLTPEDLLKMDIYHTLMNTMIFGLTSSFYEKMQEEKYLTYPLSISKSILYDFLVLRFEGESKYPKEVIEAIKRQLNDLNITEEQLERFKKFYISNIIEEFDDVEASNSNLLYMKIHHGEILSHSINVIKSITLKDYNNYVKKLDFNCFSSMVILPKE